MPEIDRVAEQPTAQVVHRMPGQHGADVGANDLQRSPGYGLSPAWVGGALNGVSRAPFPVVGALRGSALAGLCG